MSDSRATRLSLMLAVLDASAAVAWYQRALGATVLWDRGSVAALAVEGAPFLVGEPAANGWESPEVLGTTSVRVELFCADPDAVLARVVRTGGAKDVEPTREHATPWGGHRQGGFVDPFG
ncbi:MAG TPA: VOC family protein, partial [Longimicrobium sp.]|nr:VOC family protein [Longimicrobium sp.]